MPITKRELIFELRADNFSVNTMRNFFNCCFVSLGILFSYTHSVCAEEVNPKFITNQTGSPQQSPAPNTDWTGLKIKEKKSESSSSHPSKTNSEKANISVTPIKSDRILKGSSIKAKSLGTKK